MVEYFYMATFPMIRSCDALSGGEHAFMNLYIWKENLR